LHSILRLRTFAKSVADYFLIPFFDKFLQ